MNTDRAHDLDHLMAQAQTGDQDAYTRFLTGASQILRSYLSRRAPDAEVVEDILQETLLSIHRARHTYIAGRPVGPWLYAICEHRMLDFFRRYRRVERVEVPLLDEMSDLFPSADSPKAHDRGDQVLEALADLPEKQRQVIELLKIHDLSVKEVAWKTGMSESAVKVTAFRGYEAIRRMLGVKSQ